MTKALWLTEHKYECKKFCPSSSIFLYWFVDHFFPNSTITDDSTGLVWSKCTFSIFRCYRNQKAWIRIELSRRQHFLDRRLFSYETTRLDVISHGTRLLFFEKKISISRRQFSSIWLGKCNHLLNYYSLTLLLYFYFIIYPVSRIQIDTNRTNSDVGALSGFFRSDW